MRTIGHNSNVSLKWLHMMLLLFSILATPLVLPQETQDSSITVDGEGTIHTPIGVLPVSSLLSPEAQGVMKITLQKESASSLGRLHACGIRGVEDFNDRRRVLEARQCIIENMDLANKITKLKNIYPVKVRTTTIEGIEVDIVEPVDGVSENNKERVLFYIHGSAGFVDHDLMRLLGSIPVAALGRIKVLGVDHRLMPEGRFSDTQEDLARVYEAVLKDHRPENIGIFGCSMGSYLTTSMIPYLHKQGLPGPGAIAPQNQSSFAGAPDSVYITNAYGGHGFDKPMPSISQAFYDSHYAFKGLSMDDPTVQPTRDLKTLKLFPPTIIMNSLRDSSLGATVIEHRRLLQAGIETELHLWEGLPHCFQHKLLDIPETRDFWRQMLTFFEQHLGNEPLVRE